MKKLLSLAVLLMVSVSAWAIDSGVSQSIIKDKYADKYEPSDKFFQIRIEPTWLLLKELSLDFQFRLTDHFSLGPTLSYMSAGDGVFFGTQVSQRVFYKDQTNREGMGLRGVYYFKGFHRSSAYLGAFGKQFKSKITGSPSSSLVAEDSTSSGEFSETVVGGTGGYQWNWGLLSLNVGGGIANYSHPDKLTMNYSDGSSYDYEIKNKGLSYTIDAGLGLNF